MLSSGANVIIWDKMLSCGANVVMLSFGANVIIRCYHVMLSSGMITPPYFIFPENFTHSPITSNTDFPCKRLWESSNSVYPPLTIIRRASLRAIKATGSIDSLLETILLKTLRQISTSCRSDTQNRALHLEFKSYSNIVIQQVLEEISQGGTEILLEFNFA
jgi:hypothetical protein